MLALALDHHLVTRLTSLVAVDKTPGRPEGERLTLAELPLNLPAGWEFEKVFGEREQLRKTPTDRRAGDAQVQHAVLKRLSPVPTVAPTAVTLPKTATDADIRMITGAILLGIALVLFLITRRRYAPL